MIERLEKLFQPGRIGAMEIKNRIIMAPMAMEYDTDGFVSDQHIAFYTERAKGGAGLIILGASMIDPLGVFGPSSLLIHEDRYIDGYRRLADAVHPYGAKVAGQIVHCGRDAVPKEGEPVAPSAVPSRITRMTPRELTVVEIRDLVGKFGEAAKRIKEAGLDAVEILGSSGYLISQFMSPLTNKRTDKYGGSLENRLRFALEVIGAVRQRVGPGHPIIFRHSGDDFMPGGHTLKEARDVAKILEDAGVDAINVQVGWEESKVPTSFMVVPRGAFAYLPQAFKEVVSIPVIACNRINDPFVAERILQEGKADFVALGRTLLADPYFAMKAQEGRYEDICPCIACNQACLDQIFTLKMASCMVNPEASREREMPIISAPKPKRVVVVGGGPAGMEAARVLARRGHRVTLYEKEQRLGGQFNLASRCPPKWEFDSYVRYQEAQMKKLGVRVRLETEATAQFVMRDDADAVVVATGIVPRVPDVPGIDSAKVVYALDVIAGKAEVGRRVVIVGARGVGCDTALYLAEKNAVEPSAAVFLAQWGAADPETALELTRKSRPITLVRRGSRIADDIGRTVRWILLKELEKRGVRTVTDIEYDEINHEGLVVSRDGHRMLLEADTVIIAAGALPNSRLYQELDGRVPELYLIGDAKQVRDAVPAIYEGAIIGRQV